MTEQKSPSESRNLLIVSLSPVILLNALDWNVRDVRDAFECFELFDSESQTLGDTKVSNF